MADPRIEFSALSDIAKQTSEALASVARLAGPLSLGLGSVASALGILANLAIQNEKASEAATKALYAEAKAAEKAAQAAEDAYAKARSYGGGTPEQAKKAAESRAEADKAAAKAAEGAAVKGLGLASVVGATTIALTGVIAAAHQTVSALNPVLIQQFDRAFSNLQATIGVGFQPIFTAGIGLFRDIAQAVAPLFIALKPVVETLANAITGVLSSSISAIVPLFAALVPVVALLVTAIQPLLSVTSLLTTVFAAIVQVALIPFTIIAQALNAILAPIVGLFRAITEGLQGFISALVKIVGVLGESLGALIEGVFGGFLQDTIKQTVAAFDELTKITVIVVATLAKLAGADDVVKRLIKAFGNQSSIAQGPSSIKGLEQIGKDLALASVTAVAAGSPKEKTNADILAALEKIDKTNKEGLYAIVDKLPGSETLSTARKVFTDTPGYNYEDNRAVRGAIDFVRGFSLGAVDLRKRGG